MAIRLEEFNKNQRVYNRGQNENKYSYQAENNDSIPNTTQYIRRDANPDTAPYIKQDDREEYNVEMAGISGSNFVRQKNKNLWKIKVVYCIITIAVFLFTPFLITISMTGVIESDISDSLVEMRRVNVKYKSGSQAMDVSKYMIGVMATRLSMSSEIEVLKAESIMIRTEIYRCMEDEMTIDSTDLNLDYLNEKEMKSLWGDSYTSNYNLIVDCISATSGMLINCNGQLIEPMYHEVSSGKTRNASQAIAEGASDYSYLASVTCEHDIESTNYLAVKTFSYDDFVKAFSEKYGEINISKENPSESIQIVSRCSADYIVKIQVGNVLMTGEEFAKVLDLNSSCLWMETSNNVVKITTKGKGNGLGVSIYTANYMAKNGSTYEQILNNFYSNISIMSE